MLRDLDKVLEKLLHEEGNIPRGDIDIAFDTPNGEWSSSLNRPAINCWCFDIRENVNLRVAGLETRITNNQSRTQMVPRRIDLAYLITAWARKVEDEHQLIWRALETLKRFPILHPDDCEGELRHQKRNIPMTVAEPNELGINYADLWGVLDNQMKLGFITIITLELDPNIGFDAPLVLEAEVTVGRKSMEPAARTLTETDVIIRHPKPDTEPEED